MKAKLIYKGGEGSGHHGHVGRPGKVGGSASSNIIDMSRKYVNSAANIDKTLSWYRSGGAYEMNRQLRNNLPVSGMGKKMLKIMQNAPQLPEVLRVYRGLDVYSKMTNADAGIMSTTLDESVTRGFINTKKIVDVHGFDKYVEDGTVLVLDVQPNVRALYIEDSNTQNAGQEEVLLQPGVKLTEKSRNIMRTKNGGQITYIYADVNI